MTNSYTGISKDELYLVSRAGEQFNLLVFEKFNDIFAHRNYLSEI